MIQSLNDAVRALLERYDRNGVSIMQEPFEALRLALASQEGEGGEWVLVPREPPPELVEDLKRGWDLTASGATELYEHLIQSASEASGVPASPPSTAQPAPVGDAGLVEEARALAGDWHRRAEAIRYRQVEETNETLATKWEARAEAYDRLSEELERIVGEADPF